MLKRISRTSKFGALIFGHKPGLEELSEHGGSFLLTSIAPGMPKNDSSSTAPEAVSQLINGRAAQHSGQLPTFEGKSCSHGSSFTIPLVGSHDVPTESLCVAL